MVRIRFNSSGGCGLILMIILLLLIFNIFIGGWSIGVILGWIGIKIPFWISGAVGIVAGEFTVPIAIVGSILKLLF